jgi:hypothetical protein
MIGCEGKQIENENGGFEREKSKTELKVRND